MSLAKPTRADSREEQSVNALFECLASSERRRLLGILHEQAPNSLPRRELARRLVSGHHSGAAEEDSHPDLQQMMLRLHHKHLPRLEAAGLIERDTDPESVMITDHPAFADEGIPAVIDPSLDATDDSLDTLFRALANDRRRIILDMLSHQRRPIHTETLARELGAKEQGIAESEVPADKVEKILVNLTHVHLPRLADAGLVEYDPEAEVVEGIAGMLR